MGSPEMFMVMDCIEWCGSRENYAGFACSGKFMACYCEKNPADNKQVEIKPLDKSKPRIEPG